MKLRGFLINPWKKELAEVAVERDIHAWHKLLHCDCLCAARIGFCDDLSLDCWVDDNGLLQEPPAPFFQVITYPEPLCGYGLVLASDASGESVSIPNVVLLELFAIDLNLKFEQWEHRMEPIDYPEHMI